ncbi:MAG: Rieske (2Fe-2S) protein [Flavobacteriales bacterium]|jgi:nitrite reductase/ring-hydroxylating ferredoxin subunit
MRSLTLPSAFLALALLAMAGCKKEERGGVPLTPVDISINVNNPSYADLQVPGGWLYLTGGSMGLIVYRTSMESFVAMDRHCTYNPAQLCRVFVDESQLIAQDTVCCQSKFLITDGTVVQGPAAINLQRYNTTFNGTTLRIFN